MKEIGDKKRVSIKELEKSGLYKQELLNSLKIGDFKDLGILPMEKRADREFMEPLLYAVKNDVDTYKVYTYYAENLQNDIELATKIIQDEPELIENTPVSNNKQFIIDNAEAHPEIVQYISPTLKSDISFVGELCKTENPDIIGELTKNSIITTAIMQNLELRENKDFMNLAISEDANNIKYASDDLKSDYKFIKQTCENNSGVIEYVANNTMEFGVEGLKAAEDVAVDNSSKEAIEGFEEESKKVKEKMNGEVNSDELEELLKRDKQLERHAQLFRDIRDGKRDPIRAARLINMLCKNMDEEYRNKLDQILKIDGAITEKESEQKKEKNDNSNIGIDDIERTTENAEIGEINADTTVIKGNIQPKQQLEKKEEGITHE